MQQVLVTSRAFKPDSASAQRLRAGGCELVFANASKDLTEPELIALLSPPRYLAVIADLDDFSAKVIAAAAPALKLIARFGTGTNTVDVTAARQAGVIVTNTPGANAVSVAELTVGFLICLSRHILPQDRSIRAGGWQRSIGPELAGKTISLIGLGAIGGEVAKRCRALGMNVLAVAPHPRPGFDQELGFTYVDFESALKQADFVSLHLPATELTRSLINKESLALMKPSAYLINTARGELIQENALFDALSGRRIAGAALDVFGQEPFTDARYFALDNVIMTPHAGGNSFEAIERMEAATAAEVLRLLAGEPPLHPVKPRPEN